MNLHTARRQFHAQRVKRQLATLGKPFTHKAGMRPQLALAWPVTLPAWRKPTRRSAEQHQVVHKTWRHPKVPCCFPVAVAFRNKRGNPLAQFNRVWLTHRGSPSTAMNHKLTDQ